MKKKDTGYWIQRKFAILNYIDDVINDAAQLNQSLFKEYVLINKNPKFLCEHPRTNF